MAAELDIADHRTWPEWLTVDEAALVLRCSPRTVKRRIAAWLAQTEGRPVTVLPLRAVRNGPAGRWLIARIDVAPPAVEQPKP